MLELVFNQGGDVSAFSQVNADSELRFYCVFFVVFGVFSMRYARDVGANLNGIAVLMAVFFMGGIGRLLSLWSLGSPSPIFVWLMWIELLLPIVMGIMLYSLRRKSR